MRAAVLVLCVVLAGCTQATTAVPAASEALRAAEVAPQNATGSASMAGAITLMALGGHATPTDRVGLTFTLPESYVDATITLSWSAAFPTNDALALRLHEPGVLDAEGRVVGSSRLVIEAAGASPVVAALDPAIAPAGSYDVHAYTPEGETAPLVVGQAFDLAVRWS